MPTFTPYLTLAQARAEVRGLLDNTESTRWTNAQVDSGLASALSTCLDGYVSNGGDHFDIETTGTTSATDGSVALSSLRPACIRDVGVTVGNVTTRVPKKDTMRRGYADLVARTLRIIYVPTYILPTDSTHPLVGAGATPAASWLAFDKWVCADAALEVAIKDGEQPRIDRIERFAERKKKDAVQTHPSTPRSSEWPRPERSAVIEDLQWTWVPSTSTMYLVRRAW